MPIKTCKEMSQTKVITEIDVKGLFGVFDHPIHLKTDFGITLLIGANGLGKTRILQLVKAFFEEDFFEIQSQIFGEFTISFSDNTRINVIKEQQENQNTLTFRLYRGKKKTQEYRLPFKDRDLYHKSSTKIRATKGDYYFHPELEFLIRKFLPELERIAPDRWINYRTNEVLSTGLIINRYAGLFPKDVIGSLQSPHPVWLNQLTSSTKVKFIETQRLLTRVKPEEAKYSSSVDSYSKELVETIKNKRVEAIDLASKLDRTFPDRIIKSVSEASRISESSLQEELVKLDRKRELLSRVGLIDTDEVTPIQYIIERQPTQKREILNDVLHIYIEDSNKKLSAYDDLAQKIQLLIEIINKRFLYKKISIDKNKGFVFVSSLTEKDIPLSGLSSGEQHELVLFFQLLFSTEPNSLLLIDEPEISLHISWQKEFINDLKEVIRINNLAVIIATHSPDIIGNYWDLAVQLEGV